MLPSQYRLQKRNDILRIIRFGKTVAKPEMVFKFVRNRLPVSRYAIAVSAKTAKKAVDRNKVRRRIREIIRLHSQELPFGYDILITVKKPALEKSYQELEVSTLAALNQMHYVWRQRMAKKNRDRFNNRVSKNSVAGS